MLMPEEYPDSLPNWYVIHTRGRHEAKVEGALRDRGLKTFLPLVKVPSRRRDRKLILDLPLFPGYLFIHGNVDHKIYLEVIKVQGVVRILGANGNLTPVPQETVDSISTMIESGRPYFPHRFMKRGTWVRIIDGPLAGIVGFIVDRCEKKSKLVVSVELFRRAVAVQLEDDAVELYH
jgi:transcription antitermination factor NusG